VIWRVRLPRALAAYLVGGALAASGGALQALFRNALAEPGVLGVSNGAALGAVLAIFGGLAARSPIAVPAAACLGSVAVTLGLVALTGARRASNSQSLLLAGLALANLAAAGTTLTISFALANYDVGRQVLAWLLGGLDGRTWNHVAMASAPILGGTAVLLGHASSLDAMLMGDVTAAAVGVNPRRVRLHLVLATAAMTGISVAVGGAIGFVGLLVPHVARRMVGAHHAELLPACFFGGGAFLVVADILARTVIAPEELRLGVVTAVIGSPFFLFLVMRTHQAAER
jgi:iron complex transport system permease protein